jgi:hypothetical protein
MLEIVVETELGERHTGVSAGQLAELVARIGGPGDRFLVLQRLPGRPEVFAQVWHETGEAYTVEHRDGAADRHYTATVDRPEAVAAVLTAWAAAVPGWDTGLSWSLLDLEPAVAPPDLTDADRELLEQRLRTELACGYTTRAELAELAEEYLVTADRRPLSPAQAAVLADRLWQDHAAAQAAWPAETDPDRLTRAFTALAAAGITAREHFTCCRSCGHTEIGAEARPGDRGFVYFHAQCTESAATGHGLHLLYGAFDGSAEATTAVGRTVVAALSSAGLPTEWSGDPDRAITVTPLDWRRRLG